MKLMEDKDMKEQEELRIRIKELENHVQDYSDMLLSWQERFQEMEMACERERQLRQSAEIEIEALRKHISNGTDAVALPSRRSTRNEYVAGQSTAIENGTTAAEIAPMGCGRCSDDTRCQCIEEAFEMNTLADPTSTFKRPHSPQSMAENKRARQASNLEDNSEIDFTAQFATARPPTLTTSASTASSITATAPLDPCGFCQDGTPCICAQIAKEQSQQHALNPHPSILPTPKQYSPTPTSTPNPCANGPGTCTQCRSDSNSTLFCKSLASVRPPNAKTSTTATVNQGSTLTCADAFTTLSRHPGFSQATSELGTWVPQLTTVPSSTTSPQRTAFDIEAASVMGVLKLFDRRFGSQEAKATDQTLQNGTQDKQVANNEVSAFDEAAQKNGCRGTSRNSSKDGNWIAYEPGHVLKVTSSASGEPRVEDEGWLEGREQEKG